MKKIVFIILCILPCFVYSQDFDKSLCDQAVWPKCGGFEAIPGGSSSDCCEFNELNNITPENSLNLNKGMYEWDNSMHPVPLEHEVLGSCCALAYIQGNPCTISPDEVCGLMEIAPESIRNNYESFDRNGCDDDPTGKQEGEYFVVRRCGKTWKWLLTFPNNTTVQKNIIQETVVRCNNPTIVEPLITLCDGDEYYWDMDGEKYSETGTYEYVSEPDSRGCKTTTILTVVVSKPVIDEKNVYRDYGTELFVAGVSITSDTTLTSILQTEEGCDSTVVRNFIFNPQSTCEGCKEWYLSLGNIEARVFAAFGNLSRISGLDAVQSTPFILGFDLAYWLPIDFLSGSCSQSEVGIKIGIANQNTKYGDPNYCDCFNYDPGSSINFFIEPAYRWSYTGWCKSGFVPSVGVGARLNYNNNGVESVSNVRFIPRTSIGMRKYFQTAEKTRVKIENMRKSGNIERISTGFLGLFVESFHTSLRPDLLIGLEGGTRFGLNAKQKAQEEAVKKLEAKAETEQERVLREAVEKLKAEPSGETEQERILREALENN